jgi:bacterial/archaeal transporter family-2 protein
MAALVTVFAVFISVADRLDGKSLSILAVTLGVASGGIVGLQRALNGQINEHSHQSFTTSLLNFAMGLTFLTILLLISYIIGDVDFSPLPSGPWWIYTGGVLGVVYVAFTSTIVQHLGVLTFTLISVGGQLVGSLLIDLFSPTPGVQISIYLVTGIILTYLGVLVGGVNNQRGRKRLNR